MTEPAPRIAIVTGAAPSDLPLEELADGHLVTRHQWSDDIGMMDAEVLVKLAVVDEPLVVLVGDDVPELLALDLSRVVDQLHPHIAVILVREPTPALWREAARSGVRDVIARESVETDLMPALDLAVERAERFRASLLMAADGASAKGKVIVVLSPKGGSGKTMVASNLAIALATSSTGPTALVDLDCVFGDVASTLSLVPAHTVEQLATSPNFDSTVLKVFLERHERSGLHVLAGSGLPEEGEAVTDQIAGRVLDMLAQDFAYVVVDTAAGLDERALAAVERSTDIVFVATLDVASVRNLGKEINALDRLGMREARRHFVLNRADARVGLEPADAAAAVGLPTSATLPSSRLVPLSMNQGRSLVLDEPDSPVAQQLMSLAAIFQPGGTTDGSPRREQRSRFARRRR